MKILVTGADGFIGSHLVESLVCAGHEVSALCYYNFESSRGWLESVDQSVLAEVNVTLGDIRDQNVCRKICKRQDAIFNLAALIGIPYSYVAPESYIQTNINGCLNILEAGRDYGASQIIQVSTSEVYGTAQYTPIDELHPLVGQSPYAATKIAADQLALSYFRSFDVPVKVVRPFNTFGPRQSQRAVIPTIISAILNRSEIQLGDLSPLRDFTYVDDTVSAFLASLDESVQFGEVYNFGTGYALSIQSVVDVLVEESGANDLKVVCSADRKRPPKSEVKILEADNTKFKTVSGWSPKYAGPNGLRLALRKTLEWFSREAEKRRDVRYGNYHI